VVETLTLQRTQKPGFLLHLVEGVSQETRFIKGFFFRGGNPSLVETLTLQRTQKPGFLLHLVEGVSQETRFIKGFFAMNRSGAVRFFQIPAEKSSNSLPFGRGLLCTRL
jgi:hypothetical protein